MLTRKLAVALAVGCSVVAKPSEETPLSSIAMANIFQEAVDIFGNHFITGGLFNVLPCSRDNTSAIGEILCQSEIVKKISFTGSTASWQSMLFLCSKKACMRCSGLNASCPV